MNATVDLSADIGEAFGAYSSADDNAILDIVTSANIACGFHAGDPRTMDAAVRACVARNVAIGAHPSFPDLVGFGRRAMDLSPNEVRTDVLYQIGALSAFVRANDAVLNHVSPHGKLGNMVVEQRSYADAVAEAIGQFDSSLKVVTYEGALADAARLRGLQVVLAGFADRAYQDDGTLVPRSHPEAVISDPDEVARRVVSMVTTGRVRSVAGSDVSVRCNTIVLHSDTPGAAELARRIRSKLESAKVVIRAM